MSNKIASIYRKKFSVPVTASFTETVSGAGNELESFSVPEAAGEYIRQADDFVFMENLSDKAITESVQTSEGQLHEIIRDYLDDDAELHEIADKISGKDSEDLLKAVTDGKSDDYFNSIAGSMEMLEVIVRTDGSRPSFMVRNGVPDRKTSPEGEWKEFLDKGMQQLKEAVACVGRINLNNAHIGTGFTVSRDLIITNRHVLEAITDSAGKISPGAVIDFGFEYRAVASHNVRKLNGLVFSGPNRINKRINHTNLDLALISLHPAENGIDTPFLLLDIELEWNQIDDIIYTIGYPGKPAGGQYTFSLLETLFQNTFGYKRLAPGRIQSPDGTTQPWTVSHDATTLGGNSGSVILVRKNEQFAAGLHYGGTLSDPRANWGHILRQTLDTVGMEGRTLRDCLTDRNVKIS